MLSKLSTTAVFALAVSLSAQKKGEPPVHIFVLAGQSNMVGAGEVVARPDRNGGAGSLEHIAKGEDAEPKFARVVGKDGEFVVRDDVFISYLDHDGPLTTGFGGNEQQIGPEFMFGHVVGDAIDAPVLLIKVAWGGKSLAVDFRPPSAGGEVGPCYTELLERVADVRATLDKRFPALAGREQRLCGFAWHQGWNDRVNQAHNDAYAENLAHFIRDIRKDLDAPELPFALAETGMSGPEEKHPRALSLMKAQAEVPARKEFRSNTAFVPTRDLYRPADQSPTGQAYHWNNNAETYCLIGEGLAQALLGLQKAK
jgi:hypothetical protein